MNGEHKGNRNISVFNFDASTSREKKIPVSNNYSTLTDASFIKPKRVKVVKKTK